MLALSPRRMLIGAAMLGVSGSAAADIFNESYVSSSVGFVEGAVNTVLEISKWSEPGLDFSQVCIGLDSAVGANRPFIEELSRTIAEKEGKADLHNKMLNDINWHLKAVYPVCPPEQYPRLSPFVARKSPWDS
ncbi:hypothetical protein [Ferrimonas balearica]|uniref:hypothetical protein n=1 Tax=Ferrimonas balearica TaxID=44012 RepID=UPI001C9907BD|nr:hypothetical protein [Ferrimonas balearica]MBY5992368.1 hypothetical protein [Ferrimonas balearica]